MVIRSPKRTSIADAVGGDDPGLFGGGGGGGGGEGGRHGGQRRRVLHGHVLHWDAGVALGLHVYKKGGFFSQVLKPAGGVAPWIKLWLLTKRAGVRIPSELTNAHAQVR